MEFLSRLYQQASRIFGRLTASQRVTFVLLLAMIAGSLVLLVALSGGGEWVPLNGEAMKGDDLTKAAAALDQAGIAHRDSAGQLMVRQSDRYRALARLSEGGTLPANAQPFTFQDLVNSGSPFGIQSSEQQGTREQVALQNELARTLCEFRGVTAARVFLSKPPRRTFPIEGAKDQTAAVTLWLAEGTELTSPRVASVANLVAGAVNIRPDRVTVIDQRGIVRRAPAEQLGAGSTLLEQTHEVETYLSERLREHFAPSIQGLIAVASVELKPDAEQKTIHAVKEDESVIAREEEERTRTTGPPLVPAPGPIGGIGPSTIIPGAEGPSNTVETSSRVPESHISFDHSVRSIPAGTIDRITASIIIPRAYYREVAKSKLPKDQEPTDAQIQSEADADRMNIQSGAAAVLGPKAKPTDVTVDVRHIPAEPAVVAAVASAGGGMGRMVERYGTSAALLTLSLVFMGLLSRWAKRPAGALAPAPAAATMPGLSAAAASRREQEPVILPDEDISADDRRLAEMRKRIQDLVKQDPANAANLVNRWLSQG